MITVYDRIVMMISGSSQCVRVDSLIEKLGWDKTKKMFDQRRIWSVKKAINSMVYGGQLGMMMKNREDYLILHVIENYTFNIRQWILARLYAGNLLTIREIMWKLCWNVNDIDYEKQQSIHTIINSMLDDGLVIYDDQNHTTLTHPDLENVPEIDDTEF